MTRSSVPQIAVAVALVALGGGLLVSCGGGEDDEDEDRPRAAASKEGGAATGAPAAGASAAGAMGSGVITGKILFEGESPKNEMVKMSADAFCLKQHPGEVSKDEILVAADKGLANVFVYVKQGISGTYPTPSSPVVLDQHGCTYKPHVFGVMAGQPIDILNSDATLHNIHAFPETNEAFNLGMPVQGMKYTRKFDKPEVMVRIKCDVHGWMICYAGVLPHPFYGVSAPDGTYTIKDLPAGTYTLEAWHEKLGVQTQQITVADKESKTVGFTFKPAA